MTGTEKKTTEIKEGFYHLKRKLRSREEEVVVGDLYYIGKTEGVLGGTYLSFLQPVEEPTKTGKEITAMLLYHTPEENLEDPERNQENIQNGEIYLKSRDGTAREYKRGTEKFNELKEKYKKALEQRAKETSGLIKKLKENSEE
ncbi:MAG: hypothetical protein ACOC1P_06630 [Minisyncoccales bacterium]